MARIFRYVRNQQVQWFVEAGWVKHSALDGTHHGDWAALMEWPHHDRPPPEADETSEPRPAA